MLFTLDVAVLRAGFESTIAIEKVRSNDESNFGFNAATGAFEDLVKVGVIDPTKVTLSALQHTSSTLLQSNADFIVYERVRHTYMHAKHCGCRWHAT